MDIYNIINCKIYILILLILYCIVLNWANEMCHDPNAITISCYNEHLDQLDSNTHVGLNEEIIYKVAQIPGACNFNISEFRMTSVPPSSPGNVETDEVLKYSTVKRGLNSVQKYQFKKGPITLKVYPLKGHTIVAKPAACSMIVDDALPVAIIKGGMEKYYITGQKNIVDGSDSLNMNEKFDRHKNLNFEWSCKEIPPQSTEICNEEYTRKFKNNPKFVIPSQFTKREYGYVIALRVSVTGTNQGVDDHQLVLFHSKPDSIKIECIKNCPPKMDPSITSLPVILKAICNGCPMGAEDYFFWSIKDVNTDESIDYKNVKAQKGEEFYLEPNTLLENAIYTVSVDIQGKSDAKFGRIITLKTGRRPILKECVLNPSNGIALQTKFSVSCVHHLHELTFELYSIRNGQSTLLSTVDDLSKTEFVLPPGHITVLIEMTDKFGYKQKVNLGAQVSDVLDLSTKSDKEVNKIIKTITKTIARTAKEGNVEVALQQLSSIVAEFSDLPQSKMDLKLELDKQIIETMAQIEITSAAEAQQNAEILSKITDSYKDNPNPDISVRTTELCKHASEIFESHAQNMKKTEIYREKFLFAIKAMSSCSQAGLNENPETIKSATVPINLTTQESQSMESTVIEEFYSDYLDDANSSINMANFEVAAGNMKVTCFSNSRILSSTIIPEEDPVILEEGSMIIISARRYRTDIVRTIIPTEHIILRPSGDLAKFVKISIFDILMCTTNKNPYWFIDNIPLISSVVYVKFSKARVEFMGQRTKRNSDESYLTVMNYSFSRFIDPFILSFSKNENTTFKLNYVDGNLPEKTILELNDNTFHDIISTHRIYVYGNRGFILRFNNMASNHYYDILLTEMEKPTYSIFKDHHVTVSTNSNVVKNLQIFNYDRWTYLSILPNKQMNAAAGMTYTFSVSMVACYGWNETVKLWTFICRAVEEPNGNITCFCHNGEILTPYFSNNIVNVVENIKIDFLLELGSCWIIFTTTAITFLVFLTLLFIFSFEKKSDILNKVFFVGDVPSFYKFAYIVIVKTGNKRKSGTTSNITVKLHGTKSDSLEHVLNYPDPELVMLQKNNESWFVLATEKALGDIEKISIWFDSIGNNSKWYCSKIHIYDIQEEKLWKFNIHKWFDVMKDDQYNFVFTLTDCSSKTELDSTAKPTEKMVQAIGSLIKKTNERANLWKLGTKHPLFTEKERLVLIFSNLLIAYLIILLLYNVPKFNESDSIDEYTIGLNLKLIWSSIVANSFSFMIHFPLIYILENEKLQEIRKIKIDRERRSIYCWGIIFLLTIFSITSLVFCGFWVPRNTSILWLLSTLMGIVFNAIILQNLGTILLTFLIKLPTLAETFENTLRKIIRYIELQRTFIYKRFGSLSLRPYFQHLYFALDNFSLKEKRKNEMLKQQILEILEDLFMIILYVTFLYLVLLLDKESMATYSHAEIERLLSGKYIGKIMEIKMLSDIHKYFKGTLIPSFQSYLWYGNFLLVNPGMTRDFSNKYLGIIRLRQQRTKTTECIIPNDLHYLNLTCRPSYNDKREFRNFFRNWQPISLFLNDSKERMGNIWKYSSDTGTSAYLGQLAMYPGGGYVAPLGRTTVNSHINLYYLNKYEWIDLRSRAVFLEFLTYNPNCNLFNTIQGVFEISPSGYVNHKFEIQTRRLLPVDTDFKIINQLTYYCFGVILLVLIGRIVHKLYTKRQRFFSDTFSFFDMVIACLSITSIFLYYNRIVQLNGYITQLSKSNNNEFVNYFHLFVADNTFTALSASLVFIATFRLWKLLRFMIIIKITEKVLKDSMIPILAALVYHVTCMIAFSAIATIIFSSESKSFLDTYTSFTTLLLLSFNLLPNFDLHPYEHHALGKYFFVLFVMSSLYFVTVYIAIITLYYSKAKNFYSNEKGVVQQYLKNKWIYYTTLLKVRLKQLRGGQDNDERLIKPSVGERYGHCFPIPKNRMKAMALITLCVLRNEQSRRTMTEKDFAVISDLIRELFGNESEERDLFFTTRESGKIKFVDNRKLNIISDICEKLARLHQDVTRLYKVVRKPPIERRIERLNTIIEGVDILTRIMDNISITSSSI